MMAVPADAQSASDFVGTWSLVSSIGQQGDTKVDVFGPNPNGTLVFTSDGHYALIFVRSDLPKVASNNRTVETDGEAKAIAQGSVAHFGTFTVSAKNLVFHVEGSTFPNWTGVLQNRPFSLDGDKLVYTVAGASGLVTENTMRRVK
jgi:hypothetical protein